MKKVLIFIVSVICLTFASFIIFDQKEQELNEVSVNHELDNMVGVYLEDENGEYVKGSEIPLKDGGYTFNHAVCENDVEVEWNEENWSLVVPNSSSFKCDLYFEKSKVKVVDTVLGLINVNLDVPNFNKSSCTTGCEEATVGIYEETTNKGTTYYFRGDVDNNYVVFAGFYWRIIRLNENGSIRMIYSGKKDEIDRMGKSEVLANGYNDVGSYKNIGSYKYSIYLYDDFSENVGFTYTIGLQRPNGVGTNSNIKSILENWYTNNLQKYDKMIENASGFCNDREVPDDVTWSSQSVFTYVGRDRTQKHLPMLGCSNPNDLYLTKIGLITADEVAYAGGTFDYRNELYYLYNGTDYWTMTPSWVNRGSAYLLVVASNGHIDTNGGVDETLNTIPVINLSPDVTISGSGTISDPYVVS